MKMQQIVYRLPCIYQSDLTFWYLSHFLPLHTDTGEVFTPSLSYSPSFLLRLVWCLIVCILYFLLPVYVYLHNTQYYFEFSLFAKFFLHSILFFKIYYVNAHRSTSLLLTFICKYMTIYSFLCEIILGCFQFLFSVTISPTLNMLLCDRIDLSLGRGLNWMA